LEIADGEKRSTISTTMRSPTSKTPRKERVPRTRVDEALLEDRLRLNDEWVEQWEEGGKCVEDSLAPAGLPPFIQTTLSRPKVYRVEEYLNRLVAAGCRRPVLYFCLAELSSEAEAVREGRRRRSIPGEDGESTLAAVPTERRPLTTREDMEAVGNKAKAARRLIHRHRRELLLVADTKEFLLPSGIMTGPVVAEYVLALLEDSLTWVSSLAEAYTAPFEKTLLKSKGLLYLTAYVLAHADGRENRGRRGDGVGDALAGLGSLFAKRELSPSDLREKLRKFEKDHLRLYKLLVHKLDELHRHHATR
jgi:hypothetical protein